MSIRAHSLFVSVLSIGCSFSDKSVGNEIELEASTSSSGVEPSDGGAAETDGDGHEGPVSTVPPSEDDDAGGDENGDESTGEPIECTTPSAPPVTVTIADAPMGEWEVALDCTIVSRDGTGPDPIELSFECEDGGVPLAAPVVVTIDSPELELPAVLDEDATIELGVATYREADPARRSDHVTMRSGGQLLLAASSSMWWPETQDFWAPLSLSVLATECEGPELECHDLRRGYLLVESGESEPEIVPDYQLGAAFGFDVHAGEIIAGDSHCEGVDLYAWLSFVVTAH